MGPNILLKMFAIDETFLTTDYLEDKHIIA